MKPLSEFFRTKKKWYVLLAVFIAFAGLVYTKSCSSSHKKIYERYRVAVDSSWYPLSLYGKEKIMLAFIEELMGAISEESGLGFSLVQIRTPDVITDLDSGAYDAIISSIAPSSLNEAKYEFSDPIFFAGTVLLVNNSSSVESLEDLTGKFVAIPRGSALTFDFPLPQLNLIPYDNATFALDDLENKKIDAVIMGSIQAFVQMQGIYMGKVKIAKVPLTQEGLRLAVLRSQRHAAFIEVFNKSLNTLKADGQYADLLKRWGFYSLFLQGLPSAPPPKEE